MSQRTTRVVATMFLALSCSMVSAQSNYPLEGHPQGGDRRGTYYDAKGRPEDKTVPLYRDPKIYLHNMTLLAQLPERSGGPQMMTIGDRRYLVGGGAITDVTDPKNPVIVNAEAPRGDVAFNQKIKRWVVMSSRDYGVARQTQLRSGGKIPNPEAPDAEKRFVGVIFTDITDPKNPVEISRFDTGGRGVHGDGVFWDGGRYAYLASGVEGTRGQLPFHHYSYIMQILDLDDIKNPKEAGRYWVPGQMKDEQKEFETWPESGAFWDAKEFTPDLRYRFAEFHGPCYVPKRVEDGGDRAYCAWGAHGYITLDLTDIKNPKQVGRLDMSPPFEGGIPVHSAYPMPERKLVFISQEPLYQDCMEEMHAPFVVDNRAEQNPVSIASFPIPRPPEEAPYFDFCFRAYRFGVHLPNDWKAPGERRPDLIGYTWFSGGFRLYDVSNPFQPREVAWVVPKQGDGRGTESALIEWDRNIIYVFSDTGTYILSSPALGEPVLGPLKPERWSIDGLNAGAP